MSQARAVHRWLLTLLLAAVAVQFFLAGLGAFKAQQGTEDGTVGDSQFAHYFSPHVNFVPALEIIAVLVLIAAIVGKMGRRWILVSLSLPILIELQYVFANNGPSWFRALHVVNALVIASIVGKNVGVAWSERTAPAVA